MVVVTLAAAVRVHDLPFGIVMQQEIPCGECGVVPVEFDLRVGRLTEME